jgi:hypothetical protein
VSRRAATITSEAPASAVHARFNPITKQAKNDTKTMQTSANKLRSSSAVGRASRSITAPRNAFRKPKNKIAKLIASPITAAGNSARENCANGIRGKCPMITFCGFPTRVATLPMLALVASAIRYGKVGSLPRRITAITSGVSIKQTVSLTSRAERIPDVSVK